MIDVHWVELESIPAPGPEPRGIAWDGTVFWVSDEANKKIYRINPENKKSSYSFKYDGIPAGITWDGNYLWLADAKNKKIDKLNRKGKILNSIKFDRIENYTHLAFYGDFLWHADYSGTWCKINPSTNKVESSYTWGHHVCGIVHDESEFWYVEDSTPALHQISQLLGMNKINYKIAGIPKAVTWDGSSFWIVDGNEKLIKKLKPQKSE
ncbi:MAG: hypothetical protein A2161_05060 [Candidatus Schekmanbacteria bacterium RBG_13_48_7]|uniref:Glutamine cyclotransferase n=1 Tax=Candidatus Schekmanbacteria bacterium RBG_13_48_7 TaxID=1817878 RepID=A0A1F7RWF6_9BACT|nr:MAG: hypothetical protein A2161_05060 [Candidatus Schekmanbacteria bacterium RBG_13_48_7]